MIFNDLREFIAAAEERNDVKVIEGADWNLEIGLITEWQINKPNNPLLIFRNIKDYPSEYSIATNLFGTPARTAMALGLSPDKKRLDLVKALCNIFEEEFTPIPPVEVDNAPIKENIFTGDDVDLFKFPVPQWHARDGGRYIGTGNAVITKDPDSDWTNLGTYRVQIHDKSIATVFMSPGRHGMNMRNTYWERGQNCPAAVVIGMEPILYMHGHSDVPAGISEYDYTGGFKKKPVEVTRGVTTDLLIPATAEIVLEGEMIENETIAEGPFGEWTGYYASGTRPEHIFKVNAILHRTNPILQGNPPLRSPYHALAHSLRRSATAWVEVNKQIPGVKGVWLLDDAAFNMIVVVSVEQRYPGHAKQAAMGIAFTHATNYMNRFIIVVDDDIDPSSRKDVLWAMATRCEPENDIDIIRNMRGTPLDPVLPPEKRDIADYTHSTAIIDACRPYARRNEFPPTIMSTPEELEGVKKKWGKFFGLV
ncbi:UbiD family decarboxylase [Thermodesulfobacteriota bacterium]